MTRDFEQKFWDFVERDKKWHKAGEDWAKDIVDNFSGEEYENYDSDSDCLAEYGGSVFNVYPSGKYYLPFACSNVTWIEAARDECFREGAENYLDKRGYWIECGEGDPCDLFVCCAVDELESVM